MGSHRRRKWHVTTFPVVVATLGIVALAIGLMFGGLGGTGDDADVSLSGPTPTTSDSSSAGPSSPESGSDLATASSTTPEKGAADESTSSSPSRPASTKATPKATGTPSPTAPATDADGGVQLPPIDFPTCARTDHGIRCR